VTHEVNALAPIAPFAVAALLAGCTPSTMSAPGANADPEVIVVGSGAGGGPLAARLARAGVRVLLLEAGADVASRTDYQVPAMHALSTEDSALAWWYFVRHNSDDAIDRTDSKWTPDGLLYPRGAALGGSTAVNAMVSVLPPPADWDRLAALTGERAFRASAMDPYRARLAEWLDVSIPDPALALGDAQVTGLLAGAATTFAADQAGGSSPTAWDAATLAGLLAQDVNLRLAGAEATGLFRLPLATHQGSRNGTRDLLVSTVAAGYPLTIVTSALVTRVLWDQSGDQPTAIGVEFLQGATYGATIDAPAAPGTVQTVKASREVVFAAGAFNSPQLLMLSGVGDRAALSALGIPIVLDRAGVGRNLQDRVEAAVVSELAQPIDLVAACRLGQDADPCLDEWRAGHGVYQTSGFLASVLRTSPGATQPDLQIFATPGDARGYYPGYSRAALADKRHFSWLLLKAHTQNHDGTVTLVDAAPTSRPAIHFHSYDETDPLHDPDLLALVDGVRFVRRALRAATAGSPREIWPGPEVASDEQLAAFVRKESWGHHACCSDKMGMPGDPSAVVDAQFRVIGARGLRVVDASVFPEIPGTFIAMPLYLLAERAADVMLEELR
jgi:choline dehydrogenase